MGASPASRGMSKQATDFFHHPCPFRPIPTASASSCHMTIVHNTGSGEPAAPKADLELGPITSLGGRRSCCTGWLGPLRTTWKPGIVVS